MNHTLQTKDWLFDSRNGCFVDDEIEVAAEIKIWSIDDFVRLANLEVLLLEDSKSQRKVMAKRIQLVDSSWHISHASSAEAAIELIEKRGKSYDVIVVDQNLSGGGGSLLGHEFIQIIRSMNFKSTVIIGCTGSVDPQVGLQMFNSGADFIWPKPLPPSSTLLHYVSKALCARQPDKIMSQGSFGQLEQDGLPGSQDADAVISVGLYNIFVHKLMLIGSSEVFADLLIGELDIETPRKKSKSFSAEASERLQEEYANFISSDTVDSRASDMTSTSRSSNEFIELVIEKFADNVVRPNFLIKGFSVTAVEELTRYIYQHKKSDWLESSISADIVHLAKLLKMADASQVYSNMLRSISSEN